MWRMIARQTRGGLCYVGSKRHVQANHKHLEGYKPEEDFNY